MDWAFNCDKRKSSDANFVIDVAPRHHHWGALPPTLGSNQPWAWTRGGALNCAFNCDTRKSADANFAIDIAPWHHHWVQWWCVQSGIWWQRVRLDGTQPTERSARETAGARTRTKVKVNQSQQTSERIQTWTISSWTLFLNLICLIYFLPVSPS